MKYRLFLLPLLALLSLRVSARDDGFRFFSDADRAAIRTSAANALRPAASYSVTRNAPSTSRPMRIDNRSRTGLG